MSNHKVIRNGNGPLHIAEQNSIDWEALCGNRFAGPAIKSWSPGRASTAVWREWRQCPKCAAADARMRRK